ncbi:MAG: hypothetical protein QM729_21270 [Solirubrobacterales bacterium]
MSKPVQVAALLAAGFAGAFCRDVFGLAVDAACENRPARVENHFVYQMPGAVKLYFTNDRDEQPMTVWVKPEDERKMFEWARLAWRKCDK